MKNLKLTVGCLSLFAASLSAATIASAATPSFWCGTLDRELEVKAYADHVNLINPDALQGPEIVQTLVVQNLAVQTEPASAPEVAKESAQDATPAVGTLFHSQNGSLIVDLYVASTPLTGTDLYSGWVSIENGQTATERPERKEVTCVAQ